MPARSPHNSADYRRCVPSRSIGYVLGACSLGREGVGRVVSRFYSRDKQD